jgi:hypothetical protein
MREFQIRIKPEIAKRLNYRKGVLKITTNDFLWVINGKLKIQVKGASLENPTCYIDFSIDEIEFVR